jgi:hypothetical protein
MAAPGNLGGGTALDPKLWKCESPFYVSFGGTSTSDMVIKTYRCSWKIFSVA